MSHSALHLSARSLGHVQPALPGPVLPSVALTSTPFLLFSSLPKHPELFPVPLPKSSVLPLASVAPAPSDLATTTL